VGSVGQGGWLENRPSRGLGAIDVREVWRYRELLGFLALRDIKVRYKQAVFGVAWAVVQPVAAAAVFLLVFHRLAGVPSDGVPYQVFSYVSITLWAYVSTAVTRAAQSLVGNAPLVTKVYFPRLAIPMAAVLPGLVDLAVALPLVGVLFVVYGMAPSWAIMTLPVWILALVVIALGVGGWLAALNVQYRDVTHAVTLFVQLWMFLTPVAYPMSLVPEQWRLLYSLNPVAGVLEACRWALLGTPWPGLRLLVSLLVAAAALAGGLAYFKRAERRFADVI
jgi:ABC-type polysaccharide/polyol phosphate export permease